VFDRFRLINSGKINV